MAKRGKTREEKKIGKEKPLLGRRQPTGGQRDYSPMKRGTMKDGCGDGRSKLRRSRKEGEERKGREKKD